MPLDVERIRARRPQNQIHYFASIGSTMTEAARLAADGAPHGTAVLADEQTAGVGRFGRQWQSEAEAGVYCSVLLRLPVAPSAVAVVTLALGLATAEAIQHVTGLACDLRWPNDVLIGERKVAGILAQLQDGCVVAGIGINVNQPEFAENLRTPAASLRIASGGREFAREPIIAELLSAIDEFCTMLVVQGPESILNVFAKSSSYAMHRRVVFEGTAGPRKGVTEGLDANGFLLVRDDLGVLHTVYTGGVRVDAP